MGHGVAHLRTRVLWCEGPLSVEGDGSASVCRRGARGLPVAPRGHGRPLRQPEGDSQAHEEPARKEVVQSGAEQGCEWKQPEGLTPLNKTQHVEPRRGTAAESEFVGAAARRE